MRRATALPAASIILAGLFACAATPALAQGPRPTSSLELSARQLVQPSTLPAWMRPAGESPMAGSSDTLPCRDCDPPKRFWAGFGELMLVQLIPHFYNADIRDAVWAQVSAQSIKNNLLYAWQWDDNQFVNNQFSHPYHGSLYFNSARTNGYNFWESFAWPFVGSAMWEIAGEAWAPAPNDLLNTSLGGVVLGETLFRLSSLALDNTATGSERTFREIGAFILDPLRGFNRLVRGETHGVSANPPDWRPSSIFGVLDVGYRRTANQFSFDSVKTGIDQWDLGFKLAYGDAVTDLRGKPFSYFGLAAEVAGPPPDSARRLNRLSARGSLAAWPLGSSGRHQFALMMEYDYFNNPAIEYGGQSVLAGVVSTFGEKGKNVWAQTSVLFDGVVIGATKSDYYSTLEGRDYDYGPGLGASLSGTLFYKRHLQANLSYLGIWIHTIDGSQSAHYQDALSFEARYWMNRRLGLGASVTRYSRTSNYTGQPDVSQDAGFLRAFVSTAIPGIPE
jgi:Domain of unknown function (DUF3943)